ncbi:flagellar hook assembly protein FlgD [Bradyrhizobium paxllaeri]|uniref:flagellar hook assembly protein FlgD n=1 Tax=Bradyrhizobium paxllaeri TaxID=190148 RepID=UPI0008103B54|nr:flagellar hook capping FlgD N-terminal domain-containing protein [Bradyrhizobium paxllaeri]
MAIDANAANRLRSAPSAASGPGMAGLGANPSQAKTPGIAENFQTFLTLLTTQLKNQNPLDPLNTNQFTQQLVQFAQVEAQLKSNSLLSGLLDSQKAAQSTQALAFVGTTVAVDGSSASLAQGSASWTLSAPKSATAVSITNSGGQTVYSGHVSIKSGRSTFTWNGKGSDGTPCPDGLYKLSATAQDGNGQGVAVTTETEGTVDFIDLTANPALLSVGGQMYPVDKIKRVVAAFADKARV